MNPSFNDWESISTLSNFFLDPDLRFKRWHRFDLSLAERCEALGPGRETGRNWNANKYSNSWMSFLGEIIYGFHRFRKENIFIEYSSSADTLNLYIKFCVCTLCHLTSFGFKSMLFVSVCGIMMSLTASIEYNQRMLPLWGPAVNCWNYSRILYFMISMTHSRLLRLCWL